MSIALVSVAFSCLCPCTGLLPRHSAHATRQNRLLLEPNSRALNASQVIIHTLFWVPTPPTTCGLQISSHRTATQRVLVRQYRKKETTDMICHILNVCYRFSAYHEPLKSIFRRP